MEVSVNSAPDGRAEIDESAGALLRFEGERLAAPVTFFNATDVPSYRLVGKKGQWRGGTP
jgi:hypothetical protein